MSLMNDALRKKNHETTGNLVAAGFVDVSQRPRTTRRRLAVLTAMMLLTAAAFYGIHQMQSGTGNTLLTNPTLPERSRTPAVRLTETASGVQQRSDGSTLPATVDHQTATFQSEDPPKADPLAAAELEPSPPASTINGKMADTRAVDPASTLPPVDEKPLNPSVSADLESIETPVESAHRKTNNISRAFEPGPTQAGPRESGRSVVSMQTGSPAQIAPSPAPGEASAAIGGRNPGPAVQRTAPSDGDVNLFYQKACAYHRSGRLAKAIRLYRQVLNTHSNHPGAMLNLAAAYMQQGNFVEADPLLKRLEHSNPRPQGVLLNLAMAAIGMGAPEKALDYLDRAAALSDATPWEIRFHRAVAFARTNRLPEALALYREAETERPDDPRLQFNLAVTCDALGFYPEAVSHYEAVLRTPSESSETDEETITQRIRTLKRYLDTAQSPAKGQ